MQIELQPEITIHGNGVAVTDNEVSGRRVRLALAYLVLERHHSIAREDLANVLWNGAPPPSWPSSLREVVSRVRRVLAKVGCEGAIITRDRCLHVALPEDTVVDLEQVHASTRLLRGGMSDPKQTIRLTQVVLRKTDTVFFVGCEGSWLDGQRLALARARRSALEEQAEALLAEGRVDEAITCAGLLLDADPLNEGGHHLLMHIQARAGRESEALRTYIACRQLLSDELGIEPSLQMQALHLAVLRQQVPVSAAKPVAATTSNRRPSAVGTPDVHPVWRSLPPRDPATAIPCVGRDDQLRLIRNALANPGSVVILDGEMGIGKTRLLAHLAQSGGLGTTLYGSCPLGGSAKEELITAVASPGRTTVMIDDVQHADLSSLRRMSDMIRVCVEAETSLILCLRDDQPSPAATTVLAAAHRLGQPLRVHLDPLQPADVEAVATHVLGAAVSQLRLGQLARESGGVPWLLLESLRSRLGDPESGPSEGIAAVVQQRVSGLSTAAADLLAAAAMAGRAFHAADLAQVAEIDEPMTWIRATEELLERRILKPDPADAMGLMFRHGVVRTVLADSMSKVRRAHLMDRMAAADFQRHETISLAQN